MPVKILNVETERITYEPEKPLLFNIDLETTAIPVMHIEVILYDKNNYNISSHWDHTQTLPGSLFPKLRRIQFLFFDDGRTDHWGVSARGVILRDAVTS
jgi:hypothetical protein